MQWIRETCTCSDHRGMKVDLESPSSGKANGGSLVIVNAVATTFRRAKGPKDVSSRRWRNTQRPGVGLLVTTLLTTYGAGRIGRRSQVMDFR